MLLAASLFPCRQLPVGDSPSSAFSADFDADGHADLVVANGYGQNLTMFLGTGDGGFDPPVDLPVLNYPGEVVAADFNKDGHLDFATRCSGAVAVVLSDGTGSFLPYQTHPVWGTGSSIVTDDFNGDGHADLATGTSQHSYVSVLLGNGDGTFQARQDYSGGYRPDSIVAGDFDEDGHVDLATGYTYNAHGYVRLLWNDGAGGFADNTPLVVGSAVASITAADFDEDGHLDVVASKHGQTVELLLGKGDRTFQSPVPIEVHQHNGISSGDVDADGHADLVSYDYLEGVVLVHLGNGDGTLQPSILNAAGRSPRLPRVADFDEDGAPDLAVPDEANDAVSILMGLGGGEFCPRGLGAGDGPDSVFPADFNGDGAMDLAAANTNDDTVSVLLSNGDGTFQTHVAYTLSANAASLVGGDFNGDGHVDLVTGDTYLTVLLGRPDGSFDVQDRFYPGMLGYGLVVGAGHFNDDAYLDLVTAQVGGTVAILLGNGDGTFQEAAENGAVGYNPRSAFSGDFDQDGALDLAVANQGDGTVSVLLGGGDGTLQEAVTYDLPAVLPYYDVITGDDFDGDGHVDLAVATIDAVTLLLGAGDGTFADPTINTPIPPNSWLLSIARGDLNGDGKADLAVANADANRVTVMLSDGEGGFQPAQSFVTGRYPRGLCTADFNGDGALDVATADYQGDTVSVLAGSPRWTSHIDLPRRSGEIVAGDTLRLAGHGQVKQPPISFQWDFGDGRSSSLEDPGLVTFSTEGERQITLAAVDGSGAADPNPAALALSVLPDTGSVPDLVVTRLDVPGDLPVGQATEIGYSVRNQGDGAVVAGSWSDALYLSTDPYLDARDVLLGQTDVISQDLAVGESYSDSIEVLIPTSFAEGAYYLLLSVDDAWEVLELHQLNNERAVETAVLMPWLGDGIPYSGTFTATSRAHYYRVDVPAGQQLIVEVDGADGQSTNEVYLRFGELPTRGLFNHQSSDVDGADPSALAPSAAPGTWYVLVYNTSGPGDYTIRARIETIVLDEVWPPRFDQVMGTTLMLTGAGFVAGTAVELVAADATAYPADDVWVTPPYECRAHFAPSTIPLGIYSVRVSTPGGATATLEDACEVYAGGEPGILRTNLVLPSTVGYHQLATVYVEYTNAGGAPMRAPLLHLEVEQEGNAGAQLTLDHSLLTPAAFSTSAIPEGFSQSVQILASGEMAGWLMPGETCRVPVYYAGWLKPWDMTYPPVDWTLTPTYADATKLIDWAELKGPSRPEWIEADEAWDAVWSNFVEQVGDTWGDYVTMLGDNASYFGKLGVREVDVHQLLGFELRQADGLSPRAYLAAAVDVTIPAPGLDLILGRAFPENIHQRYELGPFGRGWRDIWQMTLEEHADGTVTIIDASGTPYFFQPDVFYAYQYHSPPGSGATLRAVEGEAFLLTMPGGLEYRFRPDGLLEHVEDPNGNRITLGCTDGRLTSLGHSCGLGVEIEYNPAGRVERITDPYGRQTLFSYDAENEHLLSVEDPNGRITRYGYSTGQGVHTEHALVQIEDPARGREYFTYDARGRLYDDYREGGAEKLTYTYDAAGAVSETDALGHATRYFFDNAAALLKIEDPLGNAVSYGTSDFEDLAWAVDPAGRSSQLEYDDVGNILSRTDPLGHTTYFTYTELGRVTSLLTSLTDARGNRTTYTHDTQGNLTAITYPDLTQETYAYDTAGNLASWTNRRGQTVDYAYDTQGRITRRDYPDETFVEYTYDARGNLTSTTDATGTTAYAYDEFDQLIRIDYPGGRYLQFGYDDAGRRVSSQDQLGHVVQYHYDFAGRLDRLADGTGETIIDYSYDAVGRLQREDLGNGVYTIYDYDVAGRIEGLTNYAPDESSLSSFQCVYDANGRRTAVTTLDGTWSYDYDYNGRLIHAVLTSTNPNVPDQDLSYQYDPLGNRIQTTAGAQAVDYSANEMNQYTAVGDATYDFDADGNLVRVVSPEGTTVYTYDYENRLVGVQSPQGTSQYVYDAFGNRVQVTEDGVTTHYVVDPIGWGNVVGEYDTSGSLLAHYDHGYGLVSRSDAGGDAAFYTFDLLGSTTELTGTSATTLSQYVYSPFGELLHADVTLATPFQYAGQWGAMQDEAGEILMRARAYDPSLGRFISEDPLNARLSEVNLYTYAGNDPISFVDPTGQAPGTPAHWGAGPYRPRDRGPGDPAPPSPDRPQRPPPPPPPNPPSPPDQTQQPPRSPGFSTECKQAIHELWSIVVAGGGQWNPTKEEMRSVLKTNCRWGGDDSPPPPPPPGPSGGGGGGAGGGGGDGGGGAGGSSDSTQSQDPNQKLGPAGHGDAQYVAEGRLLGYRVDFENDPSAGAPAQYVTVTDRLDAKLDWGTFELTEVGFGDHFLVVPPGTQYYETVEPMHYNGQDFEVHVQIGFDVETGRIDARFMSLVPETGMPPDVMTGFLPPEDGTGRGQGHFSYLIEQRPDLATGTEIRNVALIQFDFGEAIATNQVDPHDPGQGTDPAKEALVTIDAGVPESNVLPLDAVTTTTTFSVEWTGQDDAGGSGVGTYDVYVSDDGADYVLWLDDTPNTSAEFTGEIDHTYSFYSVATDNVGHREAAPSQADAQTTIELPPTSHMQAVLLAADAGLPADPGEAATLPESLEWIDEWDSFWIEIWGRTPDTTDYGIGSFSVDLLYDTDLFTATTIEYGPAFTEDRSGTIDDLAGLVDNLGAATLRTDVGDDQNVLLARVFFEPVAGDSGCPHNADGQYITPVEDLGLAFEQAQVELAGVGQSTVEIGASPDTDAWPVIYDVDDDGQVGFGDLAFFATAFQQKVGDAGADFAWACDFDHSGKVDVGDLAFFAENFQRTPGSPIVYPGNFPDDWQTGTPQAAAMQAPAAAALWAPDPALVLACCIWDFDMLEAASANSSDTKEAAEAIDFLIAHGYW